MATLTGQTIATSYEQLLSLPNGGLAGTNLVAITDGDSDTTCALQVATTSIGIAPTHRLYLDGASGGTGHTYINESAADIMDFYSGGTHMLSLDKTNTEVVVNEADAGIDFRVESNDVTSMFIVDASNNAVGIGASTVLGQLTVTSNTATTIDVTECPRISLYNDQDTELVDGDFLGRLTFGAREKSSSSTDRIGAYIAAIADNTWTTNVETSAARLQFHVEDVSGSYVIGTPAMTIDSGGNVGIGTTAPGELFEIAKSAGDTVMELSCWSTSEGHNSRLVFQKSGSATIDTLVPTEVNENLGIIEFYGVNNAGTPAKKMGAYILAEQDAAKDATAVPSRLLFATSDADDDGSPTERMRIDDSGNIGIGTTGPDNKLDISGDGASLGIGINCHSDTEAHSGVLQFNKSDNTGASKALVDDDAILGDIQFRGYDGDAFIHGAGIIARANGTPADNVMPTDLEFWTNDGSTSLTQRMTIAESGNVGIGTTSPNIGSNHVKASVLTIEGDLTQTYSWGEIELSGNANDENDVVIGAISFFNQSASSADHKKICSINGESDGAGDDVGGKFEFFTKEDAATGFSSELTINNVGVFTGAGSANISDVNLKENIADLTGCLAIVNQLQGKSFNWKDIAHKKALEGITQYGIIAQELEAVIPDLVTDKMGTRKKEDGTYYKSVKMGGLIPYLIEAVKELSAKVTALENA